MPRHYGLDWLRIGAFAILILYHIGMVFVPWNFHVKLAAIEWLTLPMLAVNAWRLTLLFVVSGYASRALLARAGGKGAFLAARSKRLLLPLLFGIVVIVPPQPWAELVTKHGYLSGFATFWTRDYFRFGVLDGIVLPTWNHLWFVLYLWTYTVPVAAAAALLDGARVQRLFDRVFSGIAVLAVPACYAVALHGWWLPMAGETHALIDDPIAHLMYLPAFLFGFGLAGSRAAIGAIARWWPVALALTLAGYGAIVAIELGWPGAVPAPRWIYPWYGAAHGVQQWAGIIALIGLAERWLNRDHPLRTPLSQAVFPFYLVHQTLIVVAAWAVRGRGLGPAAEFAILLAATVLGCWLFYQLGRRSGWLRPLFGLPHPTRDLRAGISP